MELHKRDGASVPNRTRKRKVLVEAGTEGGVKEDTLILDNVQRINIDARDHETLNVNSRMLSPNLIPSFGVINMPDNQNCCLISYENQAVHLDYEMMLRPSYC